MTENEKKKSAAKKEAKQKRRKREKDYAEGLRQSLLTLRGMYGGPGAGEDPNEVPRG
jgi:hypothetical protein